MMDEAAVSEAVKTYLLGLQENITATLGALDGQAFQEDNWERAEGGGGRSRVLAGGELFEQAGVNFSDVTGHRLPPAATAPIILGFAALQMIVHMIYFLHLNSKAEGGWTMLATVFTIAVGVIMLAGSIWVMYHMNKNMMPSHDQPHAAQSAS